MDCGRGSRSVMRIGVLALALLLAAPAHAWAQLSIGGFVGGEFDNEDNWLLFGAEARIALQKSLNGPYDANLRLSYHSYGSGASATQLDANLLYNFELARPGRVQPYGGAGLAFLSYKAGDFSESKVGINIVTGLKLVQHPATPLEPFMNMQYSIIRDYPNSYTLVFGVVYRLGGR
jgi:hypothetical protein